MRTWEQALLKRAREEGGEPGRLARLAVASIDDLREWRAAVEACR